MLLGTGGDLVSGSSDEVNESALQRHLDGFGRHVVPHQGRLAALGDQNLRLSTDLATGAAGVLLTVDAALTHRTCRLPFLGEGAGTQADTVPGGTDG